MFFTRLSSNLPEGLSTCSTITVSRSTVSMGAVSAPLPDSFSARPSCWSLFPNSTKESQRFLFASERWGWPRSWRWEIFSSIPGPRRRGYFWRGRAQALRDSDVFLSPQFRTRCGENPAFFCFCPAVGGRGRHTRKRIPSYRQPRQA